MIVEAVLAASRDARRARRIGRTPRRLGAARPWGELLGIGPRAGADDESWICLSARVRTGDDGDAAGDRLRAAIVRSLDCVAAVHADRSAMIESLRLTADEIDEPGGDVESAALLRGWPTATIALGEWSDDARRGVCPHGPGQWTNTDDWGPDAAEWGADSDSWAHVARCYLQTGYHGRTIRSSSADRSTAGSGR